MEIIPVIDLMGGIVVHAREGRRDSYHPIDSPLCRSSDPFAVIAAFLSLHPFRTLYIADLDALMGKASQTALIGTLAAQYPKLRFWVDSGFPPSEGGWTPVVGTESIAKGDLLDLRNQSRRDWILSLDYFDGRFTGPAEILTETELWSERVIVMTLNRVGNLAGPDWQRLQQIRQLAPEHQVITAGGVRDAADLDRLVGMGVSGALVASALHFGHLELP